MRTVTMTHPDIPGEIRVPETAVPIHMASGWVTEQTTTVALKTAASATGPVADEKHPPTGTEAHAAAAGVDPPARKR